MDINDNEWTPEGLHHKMMGRKKQRSASPKRSASQNSSGSNVKDELEPLTIKQLTEYYKDILGGTDKLPKTKTKIIEMIMNTLKSKGFTKDQMEESIGSYKLVIEGGSRKRSYTRKRR